MVTSVVVVFFQGVEGVAKYITLIDFGYIYSDIGY